jgi:beta-ureidopropionase / N-carbamoyl-L-amino-acid hydrolase
METTLSASASESVNQQRGLVESLFERLAQGSRDEPGVTRAPYGPGETFAHGVMAACAADLGLEIRTDAAANTYMTLPGRDRTLPPILIGSHLDSVAHGGNFDGAAGGRSRARGHCGNQADGSDARARHHRDGRARRGERLVPGLIHR